ncbi:hypothetical protein [Clostridium celatum]|uniref:hypothetical protein n=1 Tax=Clostridium celatum TaxID=36834 RepID=UPI001F1C40A5|nr:hypothetical protein [Clostridium celatum]MCE9656522.1 hypothetical protein [Clostridium celatum]MDU3723500.1 hypothetical protein [Clostridium celatum]MDU6295537.1 hypothetical protein [Clostridium celatum]DAN17372.1 MAG TPA: hypothetical protein [Caudoviricetes sp.]
MKIVMKKNKQLQVPDEKLEEFLALGYNEIDSEGKVVSVGKATTLAAYEAENNMLKAENAQLKEEIEKLKAEKNKDLEKKSKGKA